MQIFNLILAAAIISFTSWLSKTRPVLAGFIIALPLATLIALPMSHLQTDNPETTVSFAKGFFVGVPVSLLFFIPFLCANKLKWGFWGYYISGLLLLALGYFIHKAIFKAL